MIFFPVHIQIMGKDALTTGSASILLLCFFFVLRTLFNNDNRMIYLFTPLLLMVLTTYSSMTVSADHLGGSVRHMTEFLTSIIFFVIVTNHLYSDSFGRAEDKASYIEKFISFLLLMVAIQSIIGLLLYFKPEYGKFLAMFSTRDKEMIETQFDFTANIKRLGSLIGGGEQFGELLAVIFPLQVYKLFTDKKCIFQLIMLLFFVMIILLTATRSAIVLSIFTGMMFVFINIRNIKYRRLIPLFFILLLAVTIFPYLFPEKFYAIILKALARFDLVTSSNNIVSAINRESVWGPALNDLSRKLNFFGNGMVVKFNYHCLYLTVIYKLGIVGSCVFFFIFLKIFLSMLKALRKLTIYNRDWLLVTALFLSFSSLLINEVKFEFIRQASHQQIIWFVLALCASTAKICLNSSSIKTYDTLM